MPKPTHAPFLPALSGRFAGRIVWFCDKIIKIFYWEHRMGIFGPKFYDKIKKLRNWQQALFALTLASRQTANAVAFYSSMPGGNRRIDAFLEIEDSLWEYLCAHPEKTDLTPMKDTLGKLKPAADGTFGATAAKYAVESFETVIASVMMHSGDESLEASEISVNCLVEFLETQQEKELSEEEITENEFVMNELDFQMEVANTLSGKRSPEMFAKLRNLARNEGYSNIGISDGEGFE